MLHKCCFGLNTFWKIILETMFPKKSCVVTLLYMILYKKNASCLIFAYGEMYEYLAWKRKVSLNSFDSGFHGFIVLFGNTKDVLS